MRISVEVFHTVNKEAEGVQMKMKLRMRIRTHFIQ